MSDSGPYRELPKFLQCPRCGELLERAFEDVLACIRCEGIWITPPMAGIAFGDPAWPTNATSMWWRTSLGCPECSYAGKPEPMTAYECEGVQIDRCSTHGLWLDRGELSRVARASGNELEILRTRLLGTEPDVEKLIAKRDEWRREVEKKRKAAEEYRKWLDTDQKRRIAEAERRDADARKTLAERERALPTEEPKRTEVEQHVDKRASAEQREREAREIERDVRERAAARQNLLDARTEIAKSVADLEREIRTLRSQLHSAEARIEGERMRLRTVNEQIAHLEGEPKVLRQT